MVNIRSVWGFQTPIAEDEHWREDALSQVRDYVKKHLPSARHVVEGESKKLTPKQYRKSRVIIYTDRNGKRKYIIPGGVFCDRVCNDMPSDRVLLMLMDGHFMKEGLGLIAKDLVEPFERVSVACIKPKILQYRTAAETQADQEQAESNIRRVRDYLKQHEKMARSSAME